jgi:hypothetical protein
MAELVYALCSATSLFCAALLFRSYVRQRSRLLLWSTLCFLGLAVNSVVLFVDLAVLPAVDLRPVRTAAALVSMMLITGGLVWESR